MERREGSLGDEDARRQGNAEESIHRRDYFAPFRERRIEASSLFFDRGRRRTSPLQDMYNRKGLVDETRRLRKPAFDIMRDFYRRWKP